MAALDLKSGKPLWEWTRPIAAERAEPRLPARQPRRRDPRQHGLRRHARRLSRRARREAGRRALGRRRSATTRTGHSITLAPLAVDGKVIVGISGGEAGIRGFLDAYDAKTGKHGVALLHRPVAGEPGSETWAGDSWKTRRRRDVADRLVRSRAEAALLGHRQSRARLERRHRARATTSTPRSLLALDATPARCSWHFQFTPHDTHDWDANQIPVLVDAHDRRPPAQAGRHGQPQRLLLRARSRRPASSCTARRTRSRRGRRASTRKGRPIAMPGTGADARRARSSIRACRARPTGQPVATARRPDLLLRAGARDGVDLLQDRRRVQARARYSPAAARRALDRRSVGRGARARRDDRAS